MGPEDESSSETGDAVRAADHVGLPADWVSFYIELPTDGYAGLRRFLELLLGFTETDYCELTRPDGARATYGPCDPPETR